MENSCSKSVLDDIFVIPYKEDFILYAPLKKKAIVVNRCILSSIKELSKNPNKTIISEHIKAFLFSKNILQPEFAENLPPTELNMLPTSDCNLRCKYCFSYGGETKNYMTWNIAKAAIDYVFKNVLDQKKGKLTIYFQGSGEPTLNWNIVVKSVEYGKQLAKSKKIKTNFKITTNGVFSEDKAEWLAKNIDLITLSFDGSKEIQDKARCFPNGKGTIGIVSNTAKIFDKFGAEYSINANVTKSSVDKMVDCINFFADNFKTKYITFHESSCMGRATFDSKFGSPSDEAFLNNFFKAKRVGEKRGVGVYCNKANLMYFCTRFGGSGRFLTVGPRGYVTSMNEVDDISRPLAKESIYGAFKDGKFKIDYKKFKKLDETYIRNIGFCKRCFCLYNCFMIGLRKKNIKSFV